MKLETQKSIASWAEETFGSVEDPAILVKRAKVELEELLEATEASDTREIGKETADVAILLYRLLELHGLSFEDEVSAKMAVNRARQWKPKGDGTGSHIKS